MKLRQQENSELFEKSRVCLNCGEKLSGKYCSNCGQKSDTHRITFKNFIEHDILHGAFHFEKGMLFTAKEAFIRPGKAALDYISGKRKRYYNVFLFILLMIGLNLYLSHKYEEMYMQYYPQEVKEKINNELGDKIADFLNDYSRSIIFLYVPILSLISFLIFRRRKLNLSEHFIISGMSLLGILFISVFSYFIAFFYFTKHLKFVTELSPFMSLVCLIYVIFVYYQAFRSEYTLIGFIYRMVAFVLLLMIGILIFATILVGFLSNWEFGRIKYTR